MILTALFISAMAPAGLMIAQVGPNPATGGMPGIPEELRNRPPRRDRADRDSSEPAPFAPPRNPESRWLSDCLDQLAQDPARAHTIAQIQRNAVTGADRVLANHCLGLASVELQLWQDALTAFGEARDETPADEPRMRARFGTMAGLTASTAGDLERSEALLRTAKNDAATAASAPLEAIASSELARVLVARGALEEGLVELDNATRLQPEIAENWLLKATLLRRLERFEGTDGARTAIARAGQLAPDNPLIALEAGIIALFSGYEDEARGHWTAVQELAPGSAPAQTAQDYLAQIGPLSDDAPDQSAP